MSSSELQGDDARATAFLVSQSSCLPHVPALQVTKLAPPWHCPPVVQAGPCSSLSFEEASAQILGQCSRHPVFRKLQAATLHALMNTALDSSANICPAAAMPPSQTCVNRGYGGRPVRKYWLQLWPQTAEGAQLPCQRPALAA